MDGNQSRLMIWLIVVALGFVSLIAFRVAGQRL
jgi:hypothetical protein